MKNITRKLMLAVFFAVVLALFAVPSKAEALTLYEMPNGASVYIKENGVPKEFIIIDKDWTNFISEDEIFGVLLMRKLTTANSSSGDIVFGNAYRDSLLDSFLETTYFNKLEEGARNRIIPVDLLSDSEEYGSEHVVRKVWALCARQEMGYAGSDVRFEGIAISYFDSNAKRVATNDWGVTTHYATRTRIKGNDNNILRVRSNGAFEASTKTTPTFARPCFMLPKNVIVGVGNNLMFNSAPTVPGSITATRSGNTINVSWAASTDTDGNLAGYILERSVNGGAWSVVRNANVTSYQDSISEGWTTVQYRVKAYDSDGLESPYTVGNALPLPHITGIDVPATIPHTGGNTAITVSGVNLVNGIMVKVFDGTTEILSGNTTGNSITQTVTLPFPPNTSHTTDRTLTVKVSLDGGTTWSSFTAAVVVEHDSAPHITDVTISPVHLEYDGGTVTITVTGFKLTDGLLVKAFSGEDAVQGHTAGDDTTQTANLELPASHDYADATVYSVRASLDDGETWVTSPSVITIAARDLPAPVIEQDLDADISLVESDTLELSIEASAEAGTLSYQWHKDGSPIPEQNSDTLTMPDITLADAGDYSCVVMAEIQGKTASVTSCVCRVSVQKRADVPVIHENLPDEQTVIEWQALSLSVAASCENGSLAYEWFKDGVLLEGETNAALHIQEAGPDDEGTYFCRITSTYGLSQKSVNSISCDVDVQENTPVFENDLPDEQNVIEAHDLTLSVSAVSPAGEIAYQWYKDGAPLTGETSPELRIPSVIPLDAGEYFCRATATYGAHKRSADSNTCTVSVQGNAPKISRDLPAEIALIETQTLTLSVTATSPAGELAYTWYKDGAVIPGETGPTLHIPSVTKAHAGLYFCRVTNTYGEMQWTMDSKVCSVSIQEGPATPAIEQDLDSTVTVASGSSLSLTARASSINGMLSCQWYKDGAALPTATASSLFIESVMPEDAGRYYCVFTSSIGDVTASARTQTCLVIYDDPDAPSPTPEPSPDPEPSQSPDPNPSPLPEPTPTPEPGPNPSPEPSQRPSRPHGMQPKATPKPSPTSNPTSNPSSIPTPKPRISPAPNLDASATLPPNLSMNPSPSTEPNPNLILSPQSELIATTSLATPAAAEADSCNPESQKQHGTASFIGLGIVGILILTTIIYFAWKKRGEQKTHQ